MKTSTPETRRAAFEKAFDSLRIEGIVLDQDDRFHKLKEAYIAGELTMDQLIEETDNLSSQLQGTAHG
jgi:hypothetical protein